MNEPTISVIMPAYNAASFIESAIRSVMRQTYQNWELLVLDDRSTDETASIAEKLASQDSRIRVIRREENSGGAAKVRNQGITLARGEYIAFLDSDDEWLPEKLERQLAAMGSADFCYTSYAVIDAAGVSCKLDYIVPANVDFESLLRENFIGCSTVLMRRELAGFNTDFFHEDYVLWLQLIMDGHRGVGCPEVLTRWRYIETSRSFNKVEAAKNRWRIYRGYLHLPLIKSIRAFCSYALAGLRKYR